ncbi:MAG: hypothetical protein ACRBI6_20935 [Acidimicrobiales bacterium]
MQIVVERRDDAGGWSVVERPGPTTAEGPPEWEVWRNYRCFSMMIGRSIGSWPIDPVPAIANERGLPADLSAAGRYRLETAWGEPPAHGCWLENVVAASWLDLSDFEAFDWDTPVTWHYNALAPRGTKEITAAMRRAVLDHVEVHVWPPKGWSIAGGPPPRMSVAAPTTARYFTKQLLELVAAMRAVNRGGPTDVRCVFVIDY